MDFKGFNLIKTNKYVVNGNFRVFIEITGKN